MFRLPWLIGIFELDTRQVSPPETDSLHVDTVCDCCRSDQMGIGTGPVRRKRIRAVHEIASIHALKRRILKGGIIQIAPFQNAITQIVIVEVDTIQIRSDQFTEGR